MKVTVAILLLVNTSDALCFTMSVRHRHACSSSRPSSVSMGLFDGLKKAFDDVEVKRSASAAHILVKDRSQALQLLDQINAGEISFGDAARRHSSCSSSGKGGALGQFGPGQMTPAFDALVFSPATEIGEVNVCSTQFGTHLVKVLVRTGDPLAQPAEAAAAEAAAAEAAAVAAAAVEAASADPLRAAAEAAAAEVDAEAAAAETATAADAAAAGAAAAGAAAAGAAAADELMDVVCPSELSADRKLRIALSDARQFDVIVPEGVGSGDVFRVGPFPTPSQSG